jgi:hypothetical protein
MNKAACAFIVAVAAVLSALAPARAGLAEYVLPQPDAPMQVTACGAGIQFTGNRWGTTVSTLNTSVDFKSNSSKVAVAVLFRLQMTNVFGNVIDDAFVQASGQFGPDAPIKGNHWSGTDTWPGLAIIQCSVNRVQFSDGSVWAESKILPSPTPSPSS